MGTCQKKVNSLHQTRSVASCSCQSKAHDTHTRNSYKKLVRVNSREKLVCVSYRLASRYFSREFLASNRACSISCTFPVRVFGASFLFFHDYRRTYCVLYSSQCRYIWVRFGANFLRCVLLTNLLVAYFIVTFKVRRWSTIYYVLCARIETCMVNQSECLSLLRKHRQKDENSIMKCGSGMALSWRLVGVRWRKRERRKNAFLWGA